MKAISRCLLGLALLLSVTAVRAAEAPPPSREQIEADWLHQDEKRGSNPGAPGLDPADDAAGAVDGIKDGRWGFHTENQVEPWWQVDLGKPTPIDHVILYNRCDSMAERASQLRILASDDGVTFREAARNEGSVFYGFSDGKPLTLNLQGTSARYLRLMLPGRSYFHLDEVEVYPVGEPGNIALGKPATQSSTSQWSVRHERIAPAGSRSHPIATVLDRGHKLAENLRSLGVSVDAAEAELRQIAMESEQLPADASDQARRGLYFRAHWTVRRLAFENPLLNFDQLLFVKRAPTMFPHMSDQYYGWWSRPGGGLYLLSGVKSESPRLQCLTGDMPPGSFLGPDLAHDGKKILFAYCRFDPRVADMVKENKGELPPEVFYHVFEMNLDGSGKRQITSGRYDDFDPRYLPTGDIVFLSTRKGITLQCTQAFSESTLTADLPDSYVRCGGDSVRPVPVYTLHAMSPDGSHIRPLSAFENFEYTPWVAGDGRILYTRWDYIDRFNGHYFSVWSANQDGTNPQLVYGNYTVKPQAKTEPRSIPGSSKLMMTASAHHSITGGVLCLLDRTRGTEDAAPLKILTPDVVFPETGGSPEHYYANPWPLSEDYFLVGWSDRRLPPHAKVTDEAQNPSNAMGLYLFDAFGNQELLYRDPTISSMYPIPVMPRPVPPVQATLVDWDGVQEGRFLLQDVYQGLDGVPRGAVQRLRIIGVPPKVQLTMNNPVLGVSAEDPGKFVLGTVPVEADGSAHFRAPSGVPVFFQALDADGLLIQTMRTLTYVMPSQTQACIGCHEHRETAPPSASHVPLAALREPSRLTPGPEGSWPLSYEKLVQPVLDHYCVACHRPDGPTALAARIDLRAESSYTTLMSFAGHDLKKQAFERDRSIVGQGVAANSKLWAHLTGPNPHQGIRLDPDSRARLATWMDTYAQRMGHYSTAQERDLAEFRTRLSHLLDEPKP